MGISAYIWGLNASASAGLSSVGGQVFALPSTTSWSTYAVVGLVGYVTLCWALRFRRIKNLQSQLKFTDRASLSRMTIEEAQIIAKNAIYYEFPIFYDLSLRLALLKVGLTPSNTGPGEAEPSPQTYSVKNVAKTLVGVSDLAKTDRAPKR